MNLAFSKIKKMRDSLLLVIVIVVVHGTEFEFVNDRDGVVWVGIQGNAGQQHLSNGGLIVNAKQSVSILVEERWSGRIWSRTHCWSDGSSCIVGDCGKGVQCNGASGTPPFTYAEITLKGWWGLDYYSVSLVEGFSTTISVEPLNGQNISHNSYSCKKSGCDTDLLLNNGSSCPADLKVASEETKSVVACTSPCLAFDTDQYCCRGAYGTPQNCNSSDWPVDYAATFKKLCPDADSYFYDSDRKNFTCRAEKYVFTFG